MIRVTGYAYIRVPYDIKLDLPEEAFNEYSREEQNTMIFENVDKLQAAHLGDFDDIDTIEVEEIA